jgi:hypothetical protein
MVRTKRTRNTRYVLDVGADPDPRYILDVGDDPEPKHYLDLENTNPQENTLFGSNTFEKLVYAANNHIKAIFECDDPLLKQNLERFLSTENYVLCDVSEDFGGDLYDGKWLWVTIRVSNGRDRGTRTALVCKWQKVPDIRDQYYTKLVNQFVYCILPINDEGYDEGYDDGYRVPRLIVEPKRPKYIVRDS